mmetsp:Transcript_36759/g.105651  ORF Transcript_36759/g.105651 Transcript_36759/m.105651 type:complete len:282 (-) Transcript_36759:54-899(-)
MALQDADGVLATWRCGLCTFKNAGALTYCEVCAAPLEAQRPAPEEPAQLAEETQGGATAAQSQAPATHTCTWEGGYSQLCVFREPSAEGEGDVLALVVDGVEPLLLWDPSVPDGDQDLIAAAQERLRARVGNYGLALDAMASDGNCLFRAVARQLYGDAELHGLVRHRVVGQLYRDRATCGAFFVEAQAFETYLVEMAEDGCWGDELALRGVADAYGAEVHVVTSAGSGCYLLYVPAAAAAAGGDGPRLFLAYTYPVHYDGLTVAPPRGQDLSASSIDLGF